MIIGPYNVTFDMGRVSSSLTVKEPIESETFSGASVTNYQAGGYTDHTLIIAIGRFREDTYFPFRDNLDSQLSGCSQVSISDREIDNHKALLGSGFDPRLDEFVYSSGWWADNRTAVAVYSTYPWDDGTLSLLKTFHIERLNTTNKWEALQKSIR
jgi:hypothetical protein